MIDIIDFGFKGKNKLGFSEIHNFNDFKIVFGGNDNVNRKAVENKNVEILMCPEKNRNGFFLSFEDSGLNQVLCKLAEKNDVAIGFNFNEVLNSENRKDVLAKMMQNVRLCRKYKARMILISGAKNELEMRRSNDLISFGICLGMTAGETKQALNFEKKKIK